MNDIINASTDEELLLNYEGDGEIHLISANVAFMKEDLKRIVVVVVPCYAIDEFRSHFRMTKTTFEVVAQELAAAGAIPTDNRFGRKPIQLQKQILTFIWYMSNMEVIRPVV